MIPTPRARHRGFTLIEVLTVISIMTILMSVLLPSLSRAREYAKQTICRSNLRNIWTGVLQYTFENKDHVPFMEDVNLTDPNADPFDRDPKYKSTVGRVLMSYVNDGSWRCPSAVKGFPEAAGPEGWKMTYWFRSAGKIGAGVPFHRTKWGTGSVLDPIVSNYVNFDGRPMKYVSGRRHTPSNPYAPNRDLIGPWTFSFAIIADLIDGSETQGRPRYPHFGAVEKRNDLQAARPLFEQHTGLGRKPSRLELHAEGDKEMNIYLTRVPYPHRPGF